MTKFWNIAALATAVAVLAVPLAQAKDWQDALADVARNLPDIEVVRTQKIAEIYVDQMFEYGDQGATKEEQGQRVVKFIKGTTTWMASCSLLYALNVEIGVDTAWRQERAARLTTAHLGAFALAVSDVSPDINPTDYFASVVETRRAADESLLEEWIEYKSANGDINAEHKDMNEYCDKWVLRPITDIEAELGW